MSLSTNRESFTFNHSDQVDEYGVSVGDYTTVQNNFDSRAEQNLLDINNIKTTLKSEVENDSGAHNIKSAGIAGILSGVASTVYAMLVAIKGLIDDVYTDITNNRKLSASGNFTGTWAGLVPTASDPGLAASFNAHLSESAYKTDIVLENNTGEYAIGAFFLTPTNFDTYLYVTNDGYTFKRLSNIPMLNQHDGDMIYINGMFYFVTYSDDINYTVRIFKSTNLVDWTTTYLKFYNGSGDTQSAHGEKWLQDTDGKIYIVYGQVISGSAPTRELRPYLVEITDLDNLSFGIARQLTLNNNNKIDPFIIKKDGIYYLFVKKERTEGGYTTGHIEIWTSTDLTTWVNSTYAISSLLGYSFEGSCVNKLNDLYYLYLDNWNGDLIGGTVVCTSTDLLTWSEPQKIFTDCPTKHGFVHTVSDNKVKQIIRNYDSENQMGFNSPAQNIVNYSSYYRYNTSKGNTKYSKLFSFRFLLPYNAISVQFKIYDASNRFYNSSFNLEVSMSTTGTYSYNFKEIENIVGNASTLLKLGLDGDLFTVYIKNDSVSNCPSYYINNINYGEGILVTYHTESSFVDIAGSVVSTPTTKIDFVPASGSTVANGNFYIETNNSYILCINIANFTLAQNGSVAILDLSTKVNTSIRVFNKGFSSTGGDIMFTCLSGIVNVKTNTALTNDTIYGQIIIPKVAH